MCDQFSGVRGTSPLALALADLVRSGRQWKWSMLPSCHADKRIDQELASYQYTQGTPLACFIFRFLRRPRRRQIQPVAVDWSPILCGGRRPKTTKARTGRAFAERAAVGTHCFLWFINLSKLGDNACAKV
jgi:hypothetical protein